MRINKKIKRLLRYFFIFLAGIITLSVVYVFFSSPKMYVTTITISPDDYESRITKVVTPILKDKRWYLIPASHIAFIPNHTLIQAIKTKFPEINNVTIEHKGLQGITITFTLRTPLFKLDNGLAVDTEGVVYQEPKDITTLPTLTVRIPLPEKTKLLSIEAFAKKLTTALFKVNSILIDENKDITYTLSNNSSYIITDLKSDNETLWSTFISAITTDPLATTLEASRDSLLYIDLRFGNKVFYKFGKYGSIPTTSTTTDSVNATTTSSYDTRILAKPNR